MFPANFPISDCKENYLIISDLKEHSYLLIFDNIKISSANGQGYESQMKIKTFTLIMFKK